MLGQAQRIEELNKLRFASDAGNVPVIAFTSGKGGTGKTTLALNVANSLAAKGKRVLLVDFDLNFANVHVMLNIFPDYTLNDYFFKKLPLENVLFEYKRGLNFIFGESGSGANEKITKAKLNEFFYETKSSKKFDLIILDTASGGAPETLDIIGFADIVVTIAGTEPTAVMDAYAITKLLVMREFKGSLLVFINKAPNKAEAEIAFENLNAAVKHFLKREVKSLGYLPENSEIKKAVRTQRMFSETYSNGRAAKLFEQFVLSLSDEAKKIVAANR
jgi:flagellar biosynthesis protein FlhG